MIILSKDGYGGHPGFKPQIYILQSSSSVKFDDMNRGNYQTGKINILCTSCVVILKGNNYVKANTYNQATVIFSQAQTIQSILNQINTNSDRIPNFLAW